MKLYVIEVPGGVEGVFEKESIEEMLRKHYREEDLDYINITPYELNETYVSKAAPSMIDHKKWWQELKEDN